MSILIAVRHARSTANTAGVLAGRTPGVHLDERGREQASGLGERLRDVPLTAVVCSPLTRCRETVDIALEAAGLAPEVHLEERLLESDYGDWQGRPLAELASEPLWQVVQADPPSARFPGGEAMADVRARVVEAVLDWDQRLADDAVWMLASHGDPLAALVNWAVGADFAHVQRIGLEPASASVIQLPGTAARPPRVLATNSVAGPLTRWAAPAGAQVGGAADTDPGHPGGAVAGNRSPQTDAD